MITTEYSSTIEAIDTEKVATSDQECFALRSEALALLASLPEYTSVMTETTMMVMGELTIVSSKTSTLE